MLRGVFRWLRVCMSVDDNAKHKVHLYRLLVYAARQANGLSDNRSVGKDVDVDAVFVCCVCVCIYY
jgi:hypothetical protein